MHLPYLGFSIVALPYRFQLASPSLLCPLRLRMVSHSAKVNFDLSLDPALYEPDGQPRLRLYMQRVTQPRSACSLPLHAPDAPESLHHFAQCHYTIDCFDRVSGAGKAASRELTTKSPLTMLKAMSCGLPRDGSDLGSGNRPGELASRPGALLESAPRQRDCGTPDEYSCTTE